MIEKIELYVLMFFIYSFAGWIMETVRVSIGEKKFVNRGFLIGPFCPIYGYGVVLVSLLLKKYQDDVIVTFFMSIIICGFLEYFTSYFMEKIFKARWWDYSDRKFNINGRVCLENLVLFGIGSCIMVYLVNPYVIEGVNWLPEIAKIIIIAVVGILYLIDTIVSFNIILNLKQISSEIKDNTIEISEKVRNIIHSKSTLHRRLVEAFPLVKKNVQFKNWTLKDRLEKIGDKIESKIDRKNKEEKD